MQASPSPRSELIVRFEPAEWPHFRTGLERAVFIFTTIHMATKENYEKVSFSTSDFPAAEGIADTLNELVDAINAIPPELWPAQPSPAS